MCLISVAPKGVKKTSDVLKPFIEKGMKTNTDGSGFMYKRNNSKVINLHKGFRDPKEMLECIDKLKLKEDDEFVVHHRWSTHGEKNDINMHPFLLSSHEAILQSIKGEFNIPAMAHNGIFNSYGVHNSRFSDTYHFIEKFMSTPEILTLLKRDPEKWKEMFDVKISNQRLAFLFPDRDLILTGTFIEDNGYFHSNSGYKEYTYNRGGHNQTRDEYDFDDFGYPVQDGWERINGILVQKNDKHKTFMENRNFNRPTVTPIIPLHKRLGQQTVLEKADTAKIIEDAHRNVIKSTSIKFLDYDIEINEDNYKHFVLIPKVDFAIKGENPIPENTLLTIERFESNTIMNWVCKYAEKDKEMIAVVLERLLKVCHIFPKSEYSTTYMGLYNLIKGTNRTPSASMMKKIHGTLKRGHNKETVVMKNFGRISWFDLNNFYNSYKQVINTEINTTSNLTDIDEFLKNRVPVQTEDDVFAHEPND